MGGGCRRAKSGGESPAVQELREISSCLVNAKRLDRGCFGTSFGSGKTMPETEMKLIYLKIRFPQIPADPLT